MATNEKRYCLVCDNEVKEVESTGKFGSGELPPPFVHIRGGVNCPYQRLREDQTYTLGDSDRDATPTE